MSHLRLRPRVALPHRRAPRLLGLVGLLDLVARCLVAGCLVGGLGGLLVGCATPQSAGTNGEASTEASEPRDGFNLADDADVIRTIQLYRGSDERALPVLSMRSGGQLTLEFDLMERSGRPLSVYFEHADRQWRRDLSPAQFMESFTNDTILDYQLSRGTVVPYVHYTYRFPNDNVGFRVSGNYVIRVTEQGRPDAVLFERAFFLTEDVGALTLASESIVVTGQGRPSVRPVASYEPPAELRGDAFGYQTCFVRNGRFGASRCVDDPRLMNQPALSFEVDRRNAFAPTAAYYGLDLSTLRPGGDIERVDRSTEPYRVLLEPDYARFAGDPFQTPQNGQTRVRDAVRDRVDPHLTAEYVTATFAFVPPNEAPLTGEIAVAGSFTGMQYDPDLRMAWAADRGRYEGDVLLKLGQYEYFYDASDPQLQSILRQNVRQVNDVYTTFVYYEDLSQQTDRLLRVGSFRP